MATKFVTELPADKYGNRAYTNSQAQVIEVEVSEEYGRPHFTVIAPQTFIAKWPDLSGDHHGGWIEVEGPARFLSHEEYQALIAGRTYSQEQLLSLLAQIRHSGRRLMSKPRLLDLFCGAGGAARGYQQAGFYVVGVDIKPQPRYVGDEFHQADALTYEFDGFDVIHASPPCQHYSIANNIHSREHPALIDSIRRRLMESGKPWIIENVFGARKALPGSVLLCGVRFGLQVYRHRLFESNMLLFSPGPCTHPAYLLPGFVSVFGGGAKSRQTGNRGNAYKRFPVAYTRAAMGIDWMTRDELSQAIPPAYTEWLGRQLMAALDAIAA